MSINIVRVQAKGQVTIPKSFRKKLNLQPGDRVVFKEMEDGLLIKPAILVTEEELRAELTTVVRSIRERFSTYSASEIASLVDEALRDVRDSNT